MAEYGSIPARLNGVPIPELGAISVTMQRTVNQVATSSGQRIANVVSMTSDGSAEKPASTAFALEIAPVPSILLAYNSAIFSTGML